MWKTILSVGHHLYSMSSYEQACTTCRRLIRDDEQNACPNCGATGFSDDYSGLVVIINPEESDVAERMDIESAGPFTLKVR